MSDKREIGMLFSAPMILALLDGRKTVTRRTQGLKDFNEEPDNWKIAA
jgi:hypothetical protein